MKTIEQAIDDYMKYFDKKGRFFVEDVADAFRKGAEYRQAEINELIGVLLELKTGIEDLPQLRFTVETLHKQLTAMSGKFYKQYIKANELLKKYER